MARPQKERLIAREWLRSFLASGRKSRSEIKHAFRLDGRFGFGTLQTAKRELGVRSEKEDEWFWTLEPLDIDFGVPAPIGYEDDVLPVPSRSKTPSEPVLIIPDTLGGCAGYQEEDEDVHF
jgi:hypothetical protein